MKDKPIAIIITLLGGASAYICCMIKQAGLLSTLLVVFIALLIFMIIGLVINKIYLSLKAEVNEQERLKEEEKQALAAAAKEMPEGEVPYEEIPEEKLKGFMKEENTDE